MYNNIEELPEVLTAKEVMEYLRVGKVKAYRLMKTGEIESFWVGERNIRTTKRALQKYVEQRKEKTH